jgi:hypothetical protein
MEECDIIGKGIRKREKIRRISWHESYEKVSQCEKIEKG